MRSSNSVGAKTGRTVTGGTLTGETTTGAETGFAAIAGSGARPSAARTDAGLEGEDEISAAARSGADWIVRAV